MYGTISQRYHFLAQNPFVVAKPVVTNSYNVITSLNISRNNMENN